MNEAEKQSSRISGFFKRSIEERARIVAGFAGMDRTSIEWALAQGGLNVFHADRLIENVVGTMALPFAVATNFLVDGRDYLIPMVIEEPSVVAAASKAAVLVRENGGFHTEADDPVTISQIEILGLDDPFGAAGELEKSKDKWIAIANETQPQLVSLGGGARDMEFRPDVGKGDGRLVVHLFVDCRDAMGANMVNTMAERLAPVMAEACGGYPGLKILSNLADHRMVRVWVEISPHTLSFGDYAGERVRDGIVGASRFAESDPYRAATHNKGILNGIDAVVLATGNDWRAVEAGAHAYAGKGKGYRPLATWHVGEDGQLVGKMEMPLVMGTVGGTTRVHPAAAFAIKLLGNPTAMQLSRITASAGLASNLAALRALSTEGIQKGHMKLHQRRMEKERLEHAARKAV
ncbi:MAG: hydroxymethylglutaryl-CoA reductase, degradative [Deltaproteobacteria bacterium]|nr:hydroxymethylglutaryl-CoA reductase, degradative [Deltaproteobacteria bacterium]